MADDDPRQRGRFAAAWTAGYAAAIAPADVAVWVPPALTGPRGLLDDHGALLPVGEMVRDLATRAGAEALQAGLPAAPLRGAGDPRRRGDADAPLQPHARRPSAAER